MSSLLRRIAVFSARRKKTVIGLWLVVLLGFTLSTLAFFAAGYLVASIASTARTAQIMGQVLFFPMMFLSGATIPLGILPPALQTAAAALPLTHSVNLMRGLWFGEPWSAHLTATLVLVALLAAGVGVSSRLFRWE